VTASRYAAYPEHPLRDVPQETLDVAREALREGVITKDVDEVACDPLADSVVQALHVAGLL
jgi:hypothetical protein